MGQPIKVTLHQDIYEEALRIANGRGMRVSNYCKLQVVDALNRNASLSPVMPEGYEIIHNQTGRGTREKKIETAIVQFRLEDGHLSTINSIADKKGAKKRQIMRAIITNNVLNDHE